MNALTTLHPAVRHALYVDDGQVKTTSRHVGEVFGREHKNVLQGIDGLDCSKEFWRLNFQPSTYIDARGKEQRLIEMTFDGFVLLVMGFTGPKAAAFKEAYIAAFNAMRSQLAAAPQALLAEQVAQIAAAQAQADARMAVLERVIASQTKLIELLEKHQKMPRRRLKALTPEAHATIVELLAQGMPGAEVARIVECSETTVSLIKHGRYQHSGHAVVHRRENGQMPLIPEVEADAPLD